MYNKLIILLVKAEVINRITDLIVNETYTYPVTFSCEATGEPAPTISWLVNAVKISGTNNCNISEFVNGTVVTSVLTIPSSNVGTYTCEAKNIVGINREYAVLIVQGK